MLEHPSLNKHVIVIELLILFDFCSESQLMNNPEMMQQMFENPLVQVSVYNLFLSFLLVFVKSHAVIIILKFKFCRT